MHLLPQLNFNIGQAYRLSSSYNLQNVDSLHEEKWTMSNTLRVRTNKIDIPCSVIKIISSNVIFIILKSTD
jgi:hypothetical protein